MAEPATVIDVTERLPSRPVPADKGTASEPPGGADRATILAGLVLIGVFIVGFLAWAALAPLDSAAIAQGRISVEGNRKTISHLEGGIVREILVRDGEEVKPGQVLVRLDDTKARATLEIVRGRELVSVAQEARLTAERDGLKTIAFPADILSAAATDLNVSKIVNGQINLFNARRDSHEQQIAILNKTIAQRKEEIAGLQGQIRSGGEQIRLLEEQLEDFEVLYKKGLARKSQIFDLRRRKAEVEGARSQYTSAIARAEQQIGEVMLRINDLKSQRSREIAEELRKEQADHADMSERRIAAEDVLKRTEIVASTAGTIVGLKVFTPGGVIAPGAALMDIVPSDDRLIVEARVDPGDIDGVHPGLMAQVRVTGLNIRTTRPVDGTVLSVSADRLTDERTGQPYYLAKIELTGDLKEALDGAPLRPGMPAEVMIHTGSRTALEYAFKPLTASLDRAFRSK
jgi:HlyD family type I secretion membrane fusion protein